MRERRIKYLSILLCVFLVQKKIFVGIKEVSFCPQFMLRCSGKLTNCSAQNGPKCTRSDCCSSPINNVLFVLFVSHCTELGSVTWLGDVAR